MKKILLFISLFIFFIIPVKADTIINIQYGGSNYSEYYYLNNINNFRYKINGSNNTYACSSIYDCYNTLLNNFDNSNYQYYSISVDIYPQSNSIEFTLYQFNITGSIYQHVYDSNGQLQNISRFYYSNSSEIGYQGTIYSVQLGGWSDPNRNNFYMYFDSNYNFINNNGDFLLKGFYDNENDNINNYVQLKNHESIPKIKDLLQYSSWSDYYNNNLTNYTEVNLDNYDYVLLSLKNYNQSDPFQTNLQVKGQIGITPIYNYGQTSKDSITGSQVQDRCNVNYDSYTTYPFYILQTDLQNNAIFAIKECESGSSFKFDNSIFDITYITSQNADNPTITIGGNTYDVIPYNDLPSTATKNEEDNYIPGQSGSVVDTGGLDSAIKGVQQGLSTLWNTFTYFTDLVGLIFSSLPIELRTILLSAFVVAITIGLIKLFVSN